MRRRKRQHGAALMEFALVWPIALLLVAGAVEAAVWSAETYTVRAASLAGARAGSVAGGTAATAQAVAIRTLSAGLAGVDAAAWCPGSARPAPPLWVCATDFGNAVKVEVGGSVPALVPLVGGGGLPVHALVVLDRERFEP